MLKMGLILAVGTKPNFMSGGTIPLGWMRRQYERGKVFILLLGHDGRSFKTPEFQKIVLNGINWAAAGN
jgi:type 1 glutamine amidotransferase